MQIRQGDVFLESINEIPKETKEKDKILAYGEATGHHHRFENNEARVFIDNSGNQYCQLEEQSELIHEEHDNIKIPKGNWIVRKQREYDVSEGVRQVMD